MKISIIDFHQTSTSAGLKMKTINSNNKQQTVSNNKVITRSTTTTTNFINSNNSDSSQHKFCSSFTFNKTIPSSTSKNNMTNGQLAGFKNKRKTNNSSPTLSQSSSTTPSPNMLPTVMTSHLPSANEKSVVYPQPTNCSISPPTQQDQQFRWSVQRPNQSSNKIIKSSHQSRRNNQPKGHMFLSQVPTLVQEHQLSSLPTLITPMPQINQTTFPSLESDNAKITKIPTCLEPSERETNAFKNCFSLQPTTIIQNLMPSNNIYETSSVACSNSTTGCKPKSFRTSISLKEILN